MNWPLETRIKLGRRIKDRAMEIQEEEFNRTPPRTFSETVEKTLERISDLLEPLGFEKANMDWETENFDNSKAPGMNVYRQSPTHLWFETAQLRIFKISKEKAARLLVLGLP